MKEAKFQTLFKEYLEHHPVGATCAFEFKVAKGTTLPYTHVPKHQLRALWRAKYENLYHKISDASFGVKPFDAFCLANAQAYLVVLFDIDHQRTTIGANKGFYMIDVDEILNDLIDEKQSLTEERAKEIGIFIPFNEQEKSQTT